MFLKENVSEFFFYKIMNKMEKKQTNFFLKFTWLFPSFYIFLSCATPSVLYLCINLFFFFWELQHCEKSMILYLHFNSSSSCSVSVYRRKKMANKCDCVEAEERGPTVYWRRKFADTSSPLSGSIAQHLPSIAQWSAGSFIYSFFNSYHRLQLLATSVLVRKNTL